MRGKKGEGGASFFFSIATRKDEEKAIHSSYPLEVEHYLCLPSLPEVKKMGKEKYFLPSILLAPMENSTVSSKKEGRPDLRHKERGTVKVSRRGFRNIGKKKKRRGNRNQGQDKKEGG